MLPFEISAVAIEETVVLAFAFCLRLDSQLDFFPDSCLNDVLFVRTDRLPILYPISIIRPRPSLVSEKDERNVIFGVIYGYRWDRGNPCCPHLVLKRPEGGHLPCLLVPHATNFVEDVSWGGPKSNEDIVREKFDIALVHVLRSLYESEQFGGVRRI